MAGTFQADLRDLAVSHGAAGFGVCDADPFSSTRAELEERVATGKQGRLKFTFSRPERSTDLSISFPWAHRVIVCSMPYLPEAGTPQAAPGSGRLARFTVDRPYERLRAILEVVAGAVRDSGFQAEVVADDNRLVDRAAAVRAGVGWWGKNTMVLDPKHGPWLLLGSVVTDADLTTDDPMRRDCGTCAACLPACPTGALVAPGVLDARRCLAHHAQVDGDIPMEFRIPMGDRVYGCDDCLDACPPGARLLQRTTEPKGEVDLVELLMMDDAELTAAYEHLYIPRRRPDYLRRNALVALGNVGGPEHLPLLEQFASGPSPMLQRHAIWAIGRIGGPEARRVLTLMTVDDDVADELTAARTASTPRWPEG